MNANKYDREGGGECPDNCFNAFLFRSGSISGHPGMRLFFFLHGALGQSTDLMHSYDFLMCHGMLNRSKARATHTHTPSTSLPGMRCENSQVSWPCTQRSAEAEAETETAPSSSPWAFILDLTLGICGLFLAELIK